MVEIFGEIEPIAVCRIGTETQFGIYHYVRPPNSQVATIYGVGAGEIAKLLGKV
ncbi:MAG: hypothetical protein JO081_04765 [Alphaproteobacteria bacterium]|nr:hypothetical protein [Alphaproteobacteria bacterium]